MFRNFKGPPPLPPKDEQYIRSLSPSSSSIMSTTTTSTSKLTSFLTKLPKPPKEDDNISLPWNFQHHIHVDEGYVGLPPSWLTSAFTEEEIAHIQARRAAVLHGVQLRPPSPTTSLYPSVIQGHRRNKSSEVSMSIPASSSTPNLVAAHSNNSESLLPLPPTQSTTPTPTTTSFSLAPRTIFSDLTSASSNIVGAVKSSAGRIFRTKRGAPPSSFVDRNKGLSRLSDETFFAPELVSPDRFVSPTSPTPGHQNTIVPVWELYNTSRPPSSHSSSNDHHSLSRTPSSKNPHPFLSRSLSKSQSSLSSANPSDNPSTIHPPHRPPHLAPTHSQSPSMTSLVSIPEASPAPGAVVPAVPSVLPVFRKGSTKRKPVPASLRNPGAFNPLPSTSHLRSQSQTHLAASGSSAHTHSNSVPFLPSEAQQQPAHKHSGSTSSASSSNSNQSGSSSSASQVHEETPLPVLSLSLPRLSLSLPFGEGSLFSGTTSPQNAASTSTNAPPLPPKSVPAWSSFASTSKTTLASSSTSTLGTTSIPTPTAPAASPSRRRPLPSSKPYPGYPVPALPRPPPGGPSCPPGGSSSSSSSIPAPPTPSNARYPPSPLPPIPPSASMGWNNDNHHHHHHHHQHAALLSPPPPPNSAMFSPNDEQQQQQQQLLSPTSPLLLLSSQQQSPNSAQLWSEIAQMMDPGMLSAIPGLHLSTALPLDAQDVVRRRVVGEAEAEEGTRDEGRKGKGGAEVVLVGDVVGPSPPGSAADAAALKGDDAVVVVRMHEDEDEDEEDEDDSDEDMYDGVVQSASVVVAPHSPLPPVIHSHTQPLTRVIEPLRPRLVNVNGLEGWKGGDDALSTRKDLSSMRNSTATIVPPSDPHLTKTPHHHRPPSIKLVLSNGIGFTGKKLGIEPPESTESGGTEGGGTTTNTPFLSYYLDGTSDDTGTPSPLPSPGSALGSPLRDESDEEEEEDLTPSTPFSAAQQQKRFTYEDEFGYARRNGNAGVLEDEEDDDDDIYEEERYKPPPPPPPPVAARHSRALPLPTPTIVLNDGAHSPANDDDEGKMKPPPPPPPKGGGGGVGVGPSISTSSSATDLTEASSLSPAPSPFQQQRYLGWVSTLVAPLSEFIDECVDPREHYLDLTEIAEGESGSVFAARVNGVNARKLRLGEVVRMQDADDLGLDEDGDGGGGGEGRTKLVAIKSIALVPSGTPKLVDLERELQLMGRLWHSQVLSVDAVYVDLVEDSVWLRMELMERSLADVIVLVEAGLVLQERTIARFASDVLLALEFLCRHHIAHRDVRSDNMLINKDGILKLADFSNAVRADASRPLYTDVVGVPYWQAPELLLLPPSSSSPPPSSSSPTDTAQRTVPPYDPLKLDVWSLGSTVWEMAETVPPFFRTNVFAERWPALSRPGLYSPAFHEFLRRCSEPALGRPGAAELLKSPFINNACGRPVIVQLLAQCRTIEMALRGEDDGS